jgi:cob(I)alamin adenosyltransferase
MPRLTRIYTRSGDDGSTGLAGGGRVLKDSARIEIIGDVDELNSLLGVVRALLPPDDPLGGILDALQQHLFDLGGELAMPGQTLLRDARVERVEAWIDELNATLPPLEDFILPGGSLSAAHCHQARAVCRRAERALLRLSRVETVNSVALKYLNRLSDLLFVMARTLARRDGGREILWRKETE